MHRTVVATLIAGSLVMVGMAADARAAAPSQELQQQLIALDKQWGEAGTDTTTLNKILGDQMLALGQKGEAEGKKEQMAASTSAPGSGYVADEHKFEMLSPDVVVMTHRGTSTVTEGAGILSAANTFSPPHTPIAWEIRWRPPIVYSGSFHTS